MKQITTGDKAIQALTMHNEWWHLRSKIQVLVFQKTNRISYSKHSSRQKVLPAVNMVVPVLGLSISRGLADLLGGSIELESEVGTWKYIYTYSCRSITILQLQREKSKAALTISEYKLAEGTDATYCDPVGSNYQSN